MRHVEGDLEGVGGLRLYRQAWLPDGAAKATVVLAHGAGEHSQRYTRYHDAVGGLVDAGYAVHALDHRGHGRSEGERMMFADMGEPVADLRTLIVLARAEAEGRKVFLLGHSMGGCISLGFAMRHFEEIDGLLLSAPLAVLEAANPIQRNASLLLGRFLPRLGLYKVTTTDISRDPAVVLDYETDPLIFHKAIPASTIAALTREVDTFPAGLANLRMPLLTMHGTADRVTPPRGSKMISDGAPSDDKTHLTYDGFYHELLFEPEGERVLADVVAWLDERA